jgi:WD40 repeat protein/tRNA A-37 threonylcarbamoyl transferase component Bud32
MNTSEEIFEEDLTSYERHLEELYGGGEAPASVSWEDLRSRFARACLPGPGSLTIRLAQDQLLKERYRILGQVGRGGFAAVYKAEDVQYRNRLVALKEMSQNGVSPEELAEDIEAFQREAHLLAGLQHPHLPRIYDHFESEGRWYLIMDFIEGETLENSLRKQERRRLPLKQALEIGLQICSVLDYLHTRRPQVIFRDLKPANIMRTNSGHLYLIDFGIARHFKPGQIKDTMPFGSPGYAAPEQYGKTQSTPQSDIYSLGVLLHQMLSGHDPAEKPFLPPPLELDGAPEQEELAELIARMTSLDAAQRPRSIAEVQTALRRLAAGELASHRAIAPVQLERQRTEVAVSEQEASGEQVRQIHERPAHEGLSEGRRLPIPMRRASRRAFVGGSLVTALVGAGWLGAYLSRLGYQGGMAISKSQTIVFEPKPELIYTGHEGRPVMKATWSPLGNMIASRDSSLDLQVWDADSGTKVGEGAGIYASGFDWKPDGKSLEVLWGDGPFTGHYYAWNFGLWGPFAMVMPATPAAVYIIVNSKWMTQWPASVAFSPDGTMVGIVNDGGVQVVDVSSTPALGTNLFSQQTSFYATAQSAAWTGNGQTFAWVGNTSQNDGSGFIQYWQRGSSQASSLPGKGEMNTAVAGSRSGNMLAVGQAAGNVLIYDLNKPGGLMSSFDLHKSSISALTWSPTGTFVASGSSDGIVYVWNSADGQQITSFRHHQGQVNGLTWSPDGSHIASASSDGTVQVWKAYPK